MQNVGTLDRIGRATLSAVLIVSAIKKPERKTSVPMAYFAGILFSSSLSGYCALYPVLGINTIGKPF